MNSDNPISTIKKRYSCRTFQKNPPEETKLSVLKEYIAQLPPGPFGNLFQFFILDSEEAGLGGFSGTYGFIKNAPLYIVGLGKNEDGAGEDYGFVMEHIILKATELNLGTCWLGGTLNRGALRRAVRADQDDLIPAVSPLGIPANKSLRARIISAAAGSHKRKPWRNLFFREAAGELQDLGEQDAGDYREPLQAVRLAPSAVNAQPWRLMVTSKGVRFYLTGNPESGLNNPRINIGIAMCHFYLAALQSGLEGEWIKEEAVQPGWEYIISWVRR
jgi:hypothetical protein